MTALLVALAGLPGSGKTTVARSLAREFGAVHVRIDVIETALETSGAVSLVEHPALGYRVAIDDLGAGYAGLSCLAALSPDVVKLDMSLVRGIDEDARRQCVVASLVGLCRSLAMIVVVEGVETQAEHDRIQLIGCDLMQGYFFARPGRGFPAVAHS